MPASTTRLKAELALDAKATLGEGPVWHERRKKLFWVDILEKKLHEFDAGSGRDRAFDTGQFIGSLAVQKRGGLILALQHGFAFFNSRTKKIQPICDPDASHQHNRFNEGKCDPAGRFWAGTMDLDAKRGRGSLFWLDAKLKVRRVLKNLSIPNGMAWSRDARTMYFIDSARQMIGAFDYDQASGTIQNRRVAVRIPKRAGVPDGMTMDNEGLLWVAMWGGCKVTRWNPQNGKLLQTISLPVSLVTSCAFGGTNMDILFITSARTSLSKAALLREPLAGGIFYINPGVSGMADCLFAG